MASGKDDTPLVLLRLPSNFKTMVCNHIFQFERTINYVVRASDGDLVMMCGESDHAQDATEYKIVGLGHLTSRDSSLLSIPPLSKGWSVERKDPSSTWRLFEDPDPAE